MQKSLGNFNCPTTRGFFNYFIFRFWNVFCKFLASWSLTSNGYNLLRPKINDSVDILSIISKCIARNTQQVNNITQTLSLLTYNGPKQSIPVFSNAALAWNLSMGNGGGIIFIFLELILWHLTQFLPLPLQFFYI